MLLIIACIMMVVEIATTVILYWAQAVSHDTFWIVMAVLMAITALYILYRATWTKLSSVLARLAFCARLRRYAKKHGFRYERVHSPLRSFRKVYAGEDIRLSRGGEIYRIKFFPYFTKRYGVHLLDQKRAQFSKDLDTIARGQYALGRLLWGPKVLTARMLEMDRDVDLSFPEGEGKPVVLTYTRFKMTCVNRNSRDAIDSGYVWQDGITFWDQVAFFRFLERIAV